ncbi:hypothetical protein PT974_08415 [Cladobotryum mycophilum]|uniref:Uncharacterized protein n=1 Tax=Cladobotryum mycophilum TaxID=491253 RepID=A0ABR0SDB9_9HYPO
MSAQLSDAELMAAFTPQEKEFYDFHMKNRLATLGAKWNYQVMRTNVTKRWPDPHTQSSYFKWYTEWCERHTNRVTQPIIVHDFVENLKKTRFNDSASLARFHWMMEMQNVPFVRLGQASCGGVKTLYGLDPGIAYLWPNRDDEDETVGLMKRSVMVINTSISVDPPAPHVVAVPQKRRRELGSSDDSTSSDQTVSWPVAQLGALFVFQDSDSAIDNEDDETRYKWIPAGFGVVVRLDARGNPGAVYVIYDFLKDSDPEEPQAPPEPISYQKSDGRLLPPSIGRLREDMRDGCQFTIAKIAENLDELKNPIREFGFKVQFTDEREIVRAKIDPYGAHYIKPQYGGNIN